VKSGLEIRDYDRRGSAALIVRKLAPTSPTSGGRSVGIVRSRTKATELVMSLIQRFQGSGYKVQHISYMEMMITS
jgi:hypothetical protein